MNVATVTRLIAKNGRPATHVVRPTTPAANPWDAPTGSEVRTLVDAVFLDFSLHDTGGISLSKEEGTILKQGDQRVLISGVVADIEKGHIIREGVSPTNNPPNNVDWRIVNATIVEPGETRYLYDLVVRK